MQLSEEFDVRRVETSEGNVPNDIDVLIVAKPGSLTLKQQYAIDQYLMRGGSVIVLAGAYGVQAQQGGVVTTRTDASIFDLLRSYEVEVEDAFVLDKRNLPFPVPVKQQKGPSLNNRRFELRPYPFFADVRQEGFNPKHVAMKGIPGVAFTWSSPVKLTSKADAEGNVILDENGLPVINLPKGLKGEYLAWSSPESWLKLDTRLEPDFRTYPGDGFGAPADADLRSYPLAVSLVGTFKSHFAERPSPMVKALDADNPDNQKVDRSGGRLRRPILMPALLLSDL